MCFGFSQVYKIYDTLLAVSWGLIFANTKWDAVMVDLFLRVLVHLQAGVWLWVYMFVSGCVCQSGFLGKWWIVAYLHTPKCLWAKSRSDDMKYNNGKYK